MKLIRIPTKLKPGTIWISDDGFIHREDGPAIEYDDGVKYWFLNDRCLEDISSQENFDRYMKLKAFW
jgi:hypothetical protein